MPRNWEILDWEILQRGGARWDIKAGTQALTETHNGDNS